ncbi:MAG: hypothetical protein V4696_01775 [Pseudomonadota bacterium]
MTALAADAVRIRLEAAVAFREACEDREYGATVIRRPYRFDAFKIVPGDLAALAAQLDGLR